MAGHISKRGKKTWRVRINFGTGEDGKRHVFNGTVHGDKKDAENFLTAKLREKDLGTFVQPSRESFGKFLDAWLKETAKPRLAQSTFEGYEWLIKAYVKPTLGGRRLSDIKGPDLQRLYAKLSADGRSTRTVRYVHAVINSAMSGAIKQHKLAVNPCNAVELPKIEHKEMKAFNVEEAKRFIAAADAVPKGIIFKFAIESGCRPEEYLALKWSDLDFEKCTVTIQRALIRSKFTSVWYFDKPKTKNSRRNIPMSEAIFAQLREHRTAQREAMMKLGSEYERLDLVFANEFGRPLDIKNLRTRTFKAILKAAHLGHYEMKGEVKTFIPGFRVYDLRHSMATLMLANGENPKVVSERLGHASIVLTLDTYSHVLPDMQYEATARLGKVLYG